MTGSAVDTISSAIWRAPICTDLAGRIAACKSGDAIRVRGAAGSLPAFLIAYLHQYLGRRFACLLPDMDAARYLHSDLIALGAPALLFPATGQTPYDRERVPATAPLVRRSDVLQQQMEGRNAIVVSGVEAVHELMPPPKVAWQDTRTVKVGESVRLDALVAELSDQGFARVAFVREPGELAWRGGIVDVFPFAGGLPVRIEFFGNEIDSLREFDVATQRSISRLDAARLVPRPVDTGSGEPWVSLLACLDKDVLLAVFDEGLLEASAAARFDNAVVRYEAVEYAAELPAPEARYLNGATLAIELGRFTRLSFGAFAKESSAETLDIGGRPQPSTAGQLNTLRQQLKSGFKSFILCDSGGQLQRLTELLESAIEANPVHLTIASLSKGFELPSLGLAVYTDHEIFGRYYRPRTGKRRRTGGVRLEELQSLKPGDFVVHTEFGIGKFAGFRKIKLKGRLHEAVRLIYANDDVVFVNVNALHKLHKYAGKEGQVPSLTKLGTGQWDRAKNRAKRRIKDIARDLIRLYAQRKASIGHAYSADTIWQRELEASFAWSDTPDQFEAAEAVKRDMEASAPMDRLVCGDVGFGKTEVAIRAAFKAVQEGKQVAILVPTTVLARQHYYTFQNRLDRFPVRVDVLSRHITSGAARRRLADVAAGKVDILIGTHRLVSKDVVFKDLGLLIVDEEQRFGVRIKEKLRQLRVNVDTLTLTATPIPRTLQFSLMGARDLSIINTPPPNRQPIQTEIHSYDWALVRDAILYEISRGGQVFFIHNRVRSIDEVADRLRDLVPGARLGVGHGKMKAADLERTMTGFVDHTYDVLVSTSIVENGLDIPNANTMIIYQAHRFGLAEIHQLRGRVGRSDRKAYCYLLVPSVHDLTREARQRLQAVEQFSDLGSGFQIAMRDLDIRGAGNILGGEQSGFIADLGLATYHQMLEEAVQELRTAEFTELFRDLPALPAPESVVDVGLDASIPADYVRSDLERLALYRRIADAREGRTLSGIQEEMRDRFGPLPTAALRLMCAADMRLMAQALRLPRVQYRNQRLFLQLPTKTQDPQFYATVFDSLLNGLECSGRTYVLRQTNSRQMRAIVQDLPTLEDAVRLLAELSAASGETPE